MIRAIWLTVEKEFRLLGRDRVGIFMLLIAPIAVIAAAGFSLANVYGANPVRRTAYTIAIVDDDRGEIGRAVIDALLQEKSVRVVRAGDREQALAMVRATKQALAALVVPAGTTSAVEHGKDAQLILYTDPVRSLETLRLEVRLGELCREVTARAASRARENLDASLAKLRAKLAAASRAAERARADFAREAERSRARAQAEVQRAVEAALADANRDFDRELSSGLGDLRTQIESRTRASAEAFSRVRDYFAQLQRTRDDFDRWFDKLKHLAGSHVADIPPPPAFPEPPRLEAPPPLAPDLAQLKERLQARLAPGQLRIAIPRLAVAPAPLPPQPKVENLAGDISLPGSVGLREQNDIGGGPAGGFNVFDLQVPGFAITFLLIGMLMGISMALIDEREWGTLARLKSAAAPFSATLAGKLFARFAVGFIQVAVLFAAGRVLFGMSLGRAPLVLILPAVTIAFAGAAFGLIVAAVAGTRDAVLPVGAIVIMTMAAVGGCWWPIDFEPDWMRTVALALPTTWAMQAFNDLIIRDLPANAAFVPSAVNFVFGILYVIVGVPLARRRFG
jgi:ABC-type Na+ efflux pump permease subunit